LSIFGQADVELGPPLGEDAPEVLRLITVSR
jgi:hypothetical protein